MANLWTQNVACRFGVMSGKGGSLPRALSTGTDSQRRSGTVEVAGGGVDAGDCRDTGTVECSLG